MEFVFDNSKTPSRNDFNSIASKLLNGVELHIMNNRFIISEIEFYLHNKDHTDEYTHKDKRQLDYGTIYFHRFKNGSYKGGTFKCMDITCGNQDTQTYFGILIRSMFDVDNNYMISGPCKCVNKLLEVCNCDNIVDFPIQYPIKLDRELIRLTASKQIRDEQIYVSTRIGLSLKYPDYVNQKYRYAIKKYLINKERGKFEQLDNDTVNNTTTATVNDIDNAGEIINQIKVLQTKRYSNMKKDESKLFLIGYKIKSIGQHNFTVCNTNNDSKPLNVIIDTNNKDDKVRNTIRCNCKDYVFRCYKNNIICKHCIFILENGLKYDSVANVTGRKINDLSDLENRLNNIVIVKMEVNKQFTSKTKEFNENDTCPICLEEFGSDSENIVSCPQCKNYVHRECVQIWISRSPNCVYCRSDSWSKYQVDYN
jgi:hypothetical protein